MSRSEAERKEMFEGLKGDDSGLWRWLAAQEPCGQDSGGRLKRKLIELLDKVRRGGIEYENIKLGRTGAMTALYLYLKGPAAGLWECPSCFGHWLEDRTFCGRCRYVREVGRQGVKRKSGASRARVMRM